VRSVVTEGDRIVGVDTNEGRYESRCVILAAGPWAAQLAKGARVQLPVQACRTQVALYRRPPDFGRRGCVYGDFVQGIYFKPTHGDMIHAGSLAGEEVNDPVDPDHYNEAADGAWLPVVRQRLSRGAVCHHARLAPDPRPPAGAGGRLLCGRLQRAWVQDVADCRPADGRVDR
jgi:glycine/D-amino acid oxidase-like deaminating enzyme